MEEQSTTTIEPIEITTGGVENVVTTNMSSQTPDVSSEQIFAILGAIIIIAVIVYIISAIFLGKVFKKAGVPAWQAWVPILNTWRLLEVGGQQGFWAVLALIPGLNAFSGVFMIIAYYNINLKFKYSSGMTVLAVYLPFVWYIILAQKDKKYDSKLGAASIGLATSAAAVPIK